MKPKQAVLLRDAGGGYLAGGLMLSEAAILAAAEEIIERRFYREETLTSVQQTLAFLRSKLASQPNEQFGCIFLDNRHRLIAWKMLFAGTIDGCSVHPREVVRQALHYNAAALIVFHNHPSGAVSPSAADRDITGRLCNALKLVDVRVIDHVIIGGADYYSMAEQGDLLLLTA